jgi:hypothetical protein
VSSCHDSHSVDANNNIARKPQPIPAKYHATTSSQLVNCPNRY